MCLERVLDDIADTESLGTTVLTDRLVGWLTGWLVHDFNFAWGFYPTDKKQVPSVEALDGKNKRYFFDQRHCECIFEYLNCIGALDSYSSSSLTEI